jgi:hypothetical protein
MAMSVQVGALAEDALVLFRREFGIMVIVRRRKLTLPGKVDHKLLKL